MSSDKGTSTAKFAELRKRAQVYLAAPSDNAQYLSQAKVKRLVHELDTYQAELELQNEDLCQAREELYSSCKRYSNLYDFSPAGYLSISEKGLILEANLTAADMLGVARSQLLKQALSSFIVEEDQNTHHCCRKKFLDTKKNGVLFHAQLKSVVDSNVDASAVHFRTIITDITKEKQLGIKRFAMKPITRKYSAKIVREVLDGQTL